MMKPVLLLIASIILIVASFSANGFASLVYGLSALSVYTFSVIVANKEENK